MHEGGPNRRNPTRAEAFSAPFVAPDGIELYRPIFPSIPTVPRRRRMPPPYPRLAPAYAAPSSVQVPGVHIPLAHESSLLLPQPCRSVPPQFQARVTSLQPTFTSIPSDFLARIMRHRPRRACTDGRRRVCWCNLRTPRAETRFDRVWWRSPFVCGWRDSRSRMCVSRRDLGMRAER